MVASVDYVFAFRDNSGRITDRAGGTVYMDRPSVEDVGWGWDARWECYKNTPYNNTKKERDYELFERNNLSRNRPKESGSNTP